MTAGAGTPRGATRQGAGGGTPRVQYLVTVPPSAAGGRDAVRQEIELLRRRLAPGPLVHLHPGGRPASRLPRRWWGLLRLPRLRAAERRVDLLHLFNPDPFAFAALALLRRPLVFSVVAGVADLDRREALRAARRVGVWAVPAAADRERLARWGIERVRVVPPGLEDARLAGLLPLRAQAPPAGPTTLLMASAPWTLDQFRSKGVEALLAAAQLRPDLRLVFLWRGVLGGEMARRVAAAELEARVELIDREVDVATYLQRAHAAVLLADRPAIVKAFPHSLLEAIAAGRPVLASGALAMAGFVEERGCGEVVGAATPESLLAALERLEKAYEARRRAALAVDPAELGPEPMVAAYREIYRELLAGAAPAPAR